MLLLAESIGTSGDREGLEGMPPSVARQRHEVDRDRRRGDASARLDPAVLLPDQRDRALLANVVKMRPVRHRA